jgi:hypothetical protein
MHDGSSLGRRWSAYAPTKGLLVWACAGCIAATLVVGFTWGGWMTAGGAHKMAEEAAASARYDLAAAICVERFKAGGDMVAQLTALKDLQAWNRGSFIEKGGWATMPDRAEPSNRAATLCATRLVALEVPPATATAVPH